MTGELNLRGEVMPIGGLKEKVLAAKRNNFSCVIAPYKNRNDLKDLDSVIEGIDIIWVQHADEVLERVLEKAVAAVANTMANPLPEKEIDAAILADISKS
jgi:ATP-dependent Lon protease